MSLYESAAHESSIFSRTCTFAYTNAPQVCRSDSTKACISKLNDVFSAAHREDCASPPATAQLRKRQKKKKKLKKTCLSDYLQMWHEIVQSEPTVSEGLSPWLVGMEKAEKSPTQRSAGSLVISALRLRAPPRSSSFYSLCCLSSN